MLVKEAIAQAKTLVQSFYADEDVSGVRLEEVEFDEASNAWLITLGILRPTREGKAKSLADAFNGGATLMRTYKVIRIPNDGSHPPSMKIRELRVDE